MKNLIFLSERGPKRKLFDGEKCSICGDNGTGFNYGALTCNPCKSFFRRSILENNLNEVTFRSIHRHKIPLGKKMYEKHHVIARKRPFFT